MARRLEIAARATLARPAVLRRVLARIAEALRALVLLPLYGLGGAAPRSARQIVFGGNGDRFTDNARHLFLHLLDDPRFDCTWISGDPKVVEQVRAAGGRAELRWSPAGVGAALRAGWFVYGAYPSDVNFWLSSGARLLNLWHGIPLKAIEFDITSGPLARVYRSPGWSPLRLAFLDRFVRPDSLVSPSPFLSSRCFQSAFRVGREHCLEVGYPRTDHLFAEPDRAAVAGRVGLPSGWATDGATVIGYFPTWRDDGRDFLAEAGFSFDELHARLRAAGRRLVFKAHPNFAGAVRRDRSWSNVVILAPQVDLNEVLPVCDVLVTDYSSVAFDFLLLDRPIVYFVPDRERYEQSRNLYFALEEMAAGPIVTDVETLYRVLGGPLVDEHGHRRAELRSQVWGSYAGNASAAIAEHLASAAP